MFTPEALLAKQARGGSQITPNEYVVTLSTELEYLAIYDVQTPSSITQTANYDLSATGSGRINGATRGSNNNLLTPNAPLHVVEGVVYIGIGYSLYSFDVSDPTTISLLDTLDMSGDLSIGAEVTLAIRNMVHTDRLFVCERLTGARNPKLHLIDITDPSNIVHLNDYTFSEASGQNEVNRLSAASGYDSDTWTDGFCAVPIDKAVSGFYVSGSSRNSLLGFPQENHATNSSLATQPIVGIDWCTAIDDDTEKQTLVSFYEEGKVAFTVNGYSTNTAYTNTTVLDDPRGIRAIPYMGNYTSDRTAFCVASFDDDALVILTNPDNNGPITVRVDQYNSVNNGMQIIDVYDEWIYCAAYVYQGFSMWELTGSTSVSLAGSTTSSTYLGQAFQIGVIQ